MKARLPIFLFSAAALVSPLHAAAIMFDFGPTTVAVGDAGNSPWHSVEATGGTTWNKVSNAGNADNTAVADIATGVLFADGGAATGVGLNLGVATGSVVNLATQPTRNSNLGSNLNSGIYAGTSVAKDGIFASTSVATGVQVTGLTTGTYDIYVTARNTSFGGTYTQTGYAGGSSAGNFDYSTYATQTLSYTNAVSPTSWVQGESYMKLTVTLNEGQALNIAVVGESGGNPDRGILNSIQIVSVPEPSALLISCGMLGTLVIRRRRVA